MPPARAVAFPPALLDRVAALGGQVTDDPFAVWLPQISTSRSGPNADFVT